MRSDAEQHVRITRITRVYEPRSTVSTRRIRQNLQNQQNPIETRSSPSFLRRRGDLYLLSRKSHFLHSKNSVRSVQASVSSVAQISPDSVCLIRPVSQIKR